jgi:hypothetical protein
MTTCARCHHAEKDHCKGGVIHSSPKAAQEMSGRNARFCIGRHCTQPLCSCTVYLPEDNVKIEEIESL